MPNFSLPTRTAATLVTYDDETASALHSEILKLFGHHLYLDTADSPQKAFHTFGTYEARLSPSNGNPRRDSCGRL